MPDGHYINSTGTTSIDWPDLPPTARTAHVLPQLDPLSLVSIGVLCDHDCIATFDKKSVQIHRHNKQILHGIRLPNGLWSLPLYSPQEQANALFPEQTQRDLIQWLHAAAFSPSISTFLEAVEQNFFVTWPNLTPKVIRRYLKPSVATVKGHLNQQRQRHRKPLHVTPTPIPTRTHTIYAATLDPTQPTGNSFSDLTGRFPIQSNRGANYIFVLYDYDSNAILVRPLRNRSAHEIHRVFTSVHTYLVIRGLRPHLHTLDNEASTILKEFLTAENVEYQLVPPHIHRHNSAERAIQTFKNHFIAGLASTDPNFPLSNWCRLLPQAELTLNLLRPSRLNPKLSAYAQLEGAFDFNRTPLAPPGTRVIVHEKPTQWRTWAPHGIDGWYIGPALDHYQCYRVWIPSTHAERIADTLQFFPTILRTPTLSHRDATLQAARELTHALQNLNNANPLSQLSDDQLRALHQLSTFSPTDAPGVETQPVATPAKPQFPAPHKPAPYKQRPRPPESSPATPPSPRPAIQTRYNLRPRAPYAAPVTHADTGRSMEYRDLLADPTTRDVWLHSAANEFGRLAQGLPDNRVDATNTIFFIPVTKVPRNKRPTYTRFVCSFRPQKPEPYRTRLTVGGNLIDYPGNLSMKVADMTTFKILVNSTLSTPGAKWLGLDVKNYYLGTPMANYEYMFIPLNQIPQEIIDHYNLHNIVHKGKVYVENPRGMYGLPQAGILAETQLIHFLGKYGYSPVTHTPGLWRHQWQPIAFCLVVDDFGVKYVGREHADHLIQCLRNHYKEIDIDWTGKRFCGIHLHWDYLNRTCDLSMPGYVDHALHKFQHPTPKKPQDSPYPAAVKQYGVKVQLTDPIDTSARLPPHEIKRLQQIIGTFLFYGRAVDPTLLTALSELSSAQATATDATKRACQQFLDYCASHPDGAIRYQASDMILKLHSDSSYLNAVGARSRQGGHLYLGNKSEPDILNGAVLNLAAIMKMVLSSAAEAEFGALFHNTKEATPLRTTLEELGHPQPPTPVLVDNSTAVGLANDTITQRRSRAIDMRFYWVRDRVNQQQYHVYWAPAHHNLADYFTKHHTPSHHRKMRKYFVYTTASPKFLPTAPT